MKACRAAARNGRPPRRLNTAARSGDEAQLANAANALGQVIVDTLLDAFDSLMDGD